jgi:hypothetical protein
MLDVELSDDELRQAGRLARFTSERRRHQKHHGKTVDADKMREWHEIGIMAEMAVAKWRGVDPGSFFDYDPRRSDVDGLQVKATRPKLNLLVKASDVGVHPPSRPYVLCWVQAGEPVVQLVGWAILGHIAVEQQWDDALDVYRMPYQMLSPMLRLT